MEATSAAGSRPGAGHLAAAGVSAAALCVVSAGALGAEEVAEGPVMCPFRLATGLPCPFCGTTRSLVALGGGDLGESVSLQPLGPAVPVVAVILLVAVFSGRIRALVRNRRVLRVAAAVLLLTWAVQLGRVAL